MVHNPGPPRRSVLALLAAAPALGTGFAARAAPDQVVTVHKDPSCGCCAGWVKHLEGAGFTAKVIETRNLDPLKRRRGGPDDLAACHTAEAAGQRVWGRRPGR